MRSSRVWQSNFPTRYIFIIRTISVHSCRCDALPEVLHDTCIECGSGINRNAYIVFAVFVPLSKHLTVRHDGFQYYTNPVGELPRRKSLDCVVSANGEESYVVKWRGPWPIAVDRILFGRCCIGRRVAAVDNGGVDASKSASASRLTRAMRVLSLAILA